MPYTIERHSDATFLACAEQWLLRAEAEHNLILGIARSLADGGHHYEPPIYLATVEEEREVVGCAWRTPPFKLGLTAMPAAALPTLVADVAEVYPSLPAVLGPPAEAEGFARLWAERQGVSTERGMRQRIYRLDAMRSAEALTVSGLRSPTSADEELLARWIADFRAEARTTGPEPREWVRARLRADALFMWDADGAPVCMVGWSGRTPNGVRIGPVYTPPEHRRRGYGTAATAALSRMLLDGSARFCFLYTDLSNPTSNGIYRRIGYEPVLDVTDWDFTDSVAAAPGNGGCSSSGIRPLDGRVHLPSKTPLGGLGSDFAP